MRTTSLAASADHDFAAVTLTIAENTSRTIRSAVIEVTARDANSATTSRGSVASWKLGIKLGAVAFDDATVTDTITDSGEQQTVRFTRDVTSYFVTNFGSGTTQTSQVRFAFTNTGVNAITLINITAKLIITYEFDDAAQTTRTKTVRIPIESLTGALTNSLAEIGTNQVPNLDTFLPEASKSYKSIWFEISGNESNTTATNSQFGVSLDAEAEVQFGALEQANNSSCWDYYTWIRNDMTTNATHAFKARTSNTANAFNHVGIVLCVTYTYDHSTSTRVLNHVMVPVAVEGILPGTAAAEQARCQAKFQIQEPGTITLVQSGLALFWDTGGNVNLSVACGAQTARVYTGAAGTTTCGQLSSVQRVDSGGASGAGITLARGEVTFTADLFASSTSTLLTNVTGLLLLNYTSDIHADGDGVHAHSTAWSVWDTAADEVMRIASAGKVPIIPETAYWVIAAALRVDLIIGPIASMSLSVATEMASGENAGDGWHPLYSGFRNTDAELGFSTVWCPATDIFDRYPSDSLNRADPEGARRYIVSMSGASWKSAVSWFTYHAITYDVTETVSGSAGGTVNAECYAVDTGEFVGSTSRSGNGDVSFTVYDDTTEYFIEAYEDGSHVGRSDNLAAA